METELKLAILPEHARQLQRHHLLKQLAAEKPHSEALESTYFDTPDLYFRRHGASLRVRHTASRGWLQTLKGTALPTAGLQARDEWETSLTGSTPDLAALRALLKKDRHWVRLLRRASHRCLVPLFVTQVKRRSWMLRLPEGDLVELALDSGKIVHANLAKDISELELELKSGNAAHLYDFALSLQELVPLRINNTSKAERGFSLCVPQPPAIVTADPCDLTHSMTTEQACQTILLNCLHQIEGNADGVVHGHDPESVHQMRVGVRRLKSALILFKKCIVLPEPLQNGLTQISHVLGEARDWEVLRDSTLVEIVQQQQDGMAHQALTDAVALITRQKHQAAARAILSPHTTHWLLTFASWLTAARWRAALTSAQQDALAMPIQGYALEELEDRYRRLLNQGKKISQLNAEQVHQLRIAAKKLRYTLMFFSPLAANGTMSRLLKKLSALQDIFGKMNDLSVACDLLTQLKQRHPELMALSDGSLTYLAASSADHRRLLNREWKRFSQSRLKFTSA